MKPVVTALQSVVRAPSRRVVTLYSLLLLIAGWSLAARIGADPSVLPGPAAVWQVVVEEAGSGALWLHIGATLRRVLLAFALAMGIGGIIGLFLGRYPALDQWFSPWVTFFLNVPALVVIVLCYLWIGLNETAAIIAVSVNKAAMVTVMLREGMRARDPALSDMAQVFRLSPLARFRHVIWPQLWPFVAAATRNGLAVIWKIVLVVEFLGRPNGVGFQIHLYFQLFDTATVLAYALSFTAVMLVIELAIVQPLERRAQAWRSGADPVATALSPQPSVRSI